MRCRPRLPSWYRSSSAVSLDFRRGHDHVAPRLDDPPYHVAFTHVHLLHPEIVALEPEIADRLQPAPEDAALQGVVRARCPPRSERRVGRKIVCCQAPALSQAITVAASRVSSPAAIRRSRRETAKRTALGAARKEITSAASTSARVLISILGSAGPRSEREPKRQRRVHHPLRPGDQVVNQDGSRGRDRFPPPKVTVRSGGIPGGIRAGKGTEHRSSERWAAIGAIVVHDDLGLSAAPAARAAVQEDDGRLDGRVPGGRADQRPLDLGRAGGSTAPAGWSERDDALPGQRPPGLVRLQQVRAVTAHQGRHEAGIARQEVNGPTGALPDEATHHVPERVYSCVAGDAHGIDRSRRALAQELIQELTGAPAPTHDPGQRQREYQRGKGSQPAMGRVHGGQCAGSQGEVEGCRTVVLSA